jgi:PIN domain nuclease of toxin-antitoxin system
MIVLDTHTLIWWLDNPARLSKAASAAIEQAVAARTLHVSCFSAWEIAVLVERGRLQLTLDVRDWLGRCEKLPFVTFVPVTNDIAVESVRLPGFANADPADRIITATALYLKAPLVTKDEKIRSYSHVQTIW